MPFLRSGRDTNKPLHKTQEITTGTRLAPDDISETSEDYTKEKQQQNY